MLQPEVRQGRGPYRYDFRLPFQNYLQAQGMNWVTPHVLRHTFASLLASRGCNIYKIAKWLGDGMVTTQKHYAHLLPADDDIELSSGLSPRSSRATQAAIDFSV
jgi:integrase